jgi:uncharacterized membrane protein YcaP (DUF421 family)
VWGNGMNFIIESLFLLITSVVVVRFSGKKTVAKMTGLETVIILAIGTTMGHAVKENKLWQVVVVLIFYGIFLIFVQKMELRFSTFERYIIGEAILVIINGKIVIENLKKLRMTEKQLEMRLRQNGISYVSDVKIGTIESDGEFGYELMPFAKPVSKDELYQLLNKEEGGKTNLKSENIFEKIINEKPTSKNKNEHP